MSDDNRGQTSRMAMLVLGMAVAVAVGMVFFTPVVDAVNDNTGTQSVTNETVNAQLDEYVELQGYDIQSGTVTVYGDNDTSGNYETLDSADYDVKLGPGELQVNSSSSIVQDGEAVKVSYDYQASNELTTLVVGFIPVMFAVLLFARIAFKTQDLM